MEAILVWLIWVCIVAIVVYIVARVLITLLKPDARIDSAELIYLAAFLVVLLVLVSGLPLDPPPTWWRRP